MFMMCARPGFPGVPLMATFIMGGPDPSSIQGMNTGPWESINWFKFLASGVEEALRVGEIDPWRLLWAVIHSRFHEHNLLKEMIEISRLAEALATRLGQKHNAAIAAHDAPAHDMAPNAKNTASAKMVRVEGKRK